MNGVPLEAVLPLLVLAAVWIGWRWWDIAYRPVRYLTKWAWALVCVASVPVGGIRYVVLGREPR